MSAVMRTETFTIKLTLPELAAVRLAVASMMIRCEDRLRDGLSNTDYSFIRLADESSTLATLNGMNSKLYWFGSKLYRFEKASRNSIARMGL